MGRTQQLIVFIVVVLSILLYLTLEQFGPSPTIPAPSVPAVPAEP